ncbi:TIGR03960 family B12-binding radical SAM protein [bacterium]|nr:TIGR03960 family B12-binding radical SAM protein [candidate division CSSED10-310 bacterium]
MRRKKQHKKRFPAPTGIQRPGRYAGCEWHLADPLTPTNITVVLCYPDVYEIGMSHYGLQILYHILRTLPGVSVERAFAPWPDMEKQLRDTSQPLVTLESGTPLDQCDLLMITLPHELTYTNILTILELGRIPLRHSCRSADTPLVIGGGIATMNPLPLSPFFDGFLIGDAEGVVPMIIDAVRNGPRVERSVRLATCPGMYVPAVHGIHPDADGVTIHRQMIADLESAPYPDPPLVPMCRPVHERVVVECARGCPRQCRFCQARVYYSPVRNRSPETIRKIIDSSLSQTGYEEISLLSLNIADYPSIESLITGLMPVLQPLNVSVSLPSLRPEKLTATVVEPIRQVRKTGFTLAPEAGTDRLRAVIGKPYARQRLLDSVTSIFQAGWSQLKLYFMIGLPFETDDDVTGIIDLIHRIAGIGRAAAGSRCSLSVSIAIFIPKPHTPFQWTGQACREDIQRRSRMLRAAFNPATVKLSISSLFASRLEAVFARGDHRLGDVLESAYRAGCRMDAWDEQVRESDWVAAFSSMGIDIEAEATKHYSVEAGGMPWSFIQSGVPEDTLVKDFSRANALATEAISETDPVAISPIRAYRSAHCPPAAREQVVNHRFAGAFQVLGDFRLFAHMEIVSAIVRALRRAKIPLAYSQGFNPHPRVTVTNPAPLGFERWSEPILFQTNDPCDPVDLRVRINRELPPHMAFRTLEVVTGANPLSGLQRYAVAFVPGVNREKEYPISQIADTVAVSMPAHFGPEIDGRLQRYGVSNVLVLDNPPQPNASLKDILALFFGPNGMPLDGVHGIRLGWLAEQPDPPQLFGW